ncbi:MAG: DNA polymerase III subunit gamma/tau [Dehalococcoidia bacterium]
MATEVLYRKWRSRTFGELAGQEAVARTLTNAVASRKVSHAYLFSGPRGTGKTSTGRLLARALNCADPRDGEPCNECPSCVSYLEGRALDMVELDAASNRGIDEIRSLREKANFAPTAGGDAFKVYLVDEVHMLTEPAFNALLKTLEEPPPHVVFVLATTESHKVPPTVVSRCQRFDFRRIPLEAAVGRLRYIAEQEGIACPDEGLEAIARAATGSMRDAINLFEQLVDAYGKQPTLEQVQEELGLVFDARSGQLAAHAVRAELAEGLSMIASVRDDGLDLRQFQRQVVAYLRALLLAKAGAPSADGWSDEQLAEMRALVTDVTTERIVAALRTFGEADLRADPLSPLPLELALATSTLRTDARSPSAESSPRPQPATGTPLPRQAAQAAQPRPTPPQPAGPPRTAPKASISEPPGPAPVDSAPSDGPATESLSPPPTAPAPSGAATPQLTEARDRWPDIYQRARDLHYQTGALLNSGCGIIEADSGEVVFGFRHSVHLGRMQGNGGEHLRALQQAVDEVLGAGRTVRCVLAPEVEVQRPPRGGHLVRAAEELGGQLLEDDA